MDNGGTNLNMVDGFMKSYIIGLVLINDIKFDMSMIKRFRYALVNLTPWSSQSLKVS